MGVKWRASALVYRTLFACPCASHESTQLMYTPKEIPKEIPAGVDSSKVLYEEQKNRDSASTSKPFRATAQSFV